MKRNSVTKTVYESAKGLHKIGLIDDSEMQEFENLCNPKPKKLAPKEIRKIRLKVKAKPEEFALCLNVTPKKVKDWETGKMRPTGTALKLLNLVAKKGLKALDC